MMHTITPTRLAAAALVLAGAALTAGCERQARADESAPGAPALGELRALPSPAAPGSGEPNLAVGPDGRVYLSWIEPAVDSAHALRFAALEGDAWTAPRTIAQGRGWFVNWADFPSLAVLPDGGLAAHWLQKHGEGKYAYGVRVSRSADGGATWSPALTPHRDASETEHGFVSMWTAGGGELGAVWLDGRQYAVAQAAGNTDGEMSLMATTLGAAEGALGPERVLDARVCDCCQTAAALTSRGPVIVYRDRSPAEVRDIYVVRQVDGAWTEPRPVHADGWVINACPVNGPAVSADGERVAVAWFTAPGDSARVKVAFSGDAGAAFSAPVRVDGGLPAGRVDVELVSGGALVSWLENTGGDAAEVRVRFVGEDGKMGEPRTVARSTGVRASGFPRMALSGGDVVFAWTEAAEPSRVHVARAALGGDGR